MYGATWPYKGVSCTRLRYRGEGREERLSSFTLLHANRLRGEEEGIGGKQDHDGSRRRLRHVKKRRYPRGREKKKDDVTRTYHV